MPKKHYVTITAGLSASAGITGLVYRSGIERWLIKFRSYVASQWDRANESAQVDQRVDRESKWYSKRVEMVGSGEVIKDVSEPLSQHRGSTNPGGPGKRR